MTQSVCDKACEILRRTNDGDDLAPQHLWLIQEMVNGHLNELGEQEFEKLYQSALAGYQKPWFHGIEHLTIDHEGYVYWKGKHVEHFNIHDGWCWTQKARVQAEEVARRCRHLASIGVSPSSVTVVWSWGKYA